MKDDSLSDVTNSQLALKEIAKQINAEVRIDPWIVGKDDYWFMIGDKRLHKESWNAAIDAAISEVLKTYPYSAKEARIIREQLK